MLPNRERVGEGVIQVPLVTSLLAMATLVSSSVRAELTEVVAVHLPPDFCVTGMMSPVLVCSLTVVVPLTEQCPMNSR